RVLTAEQRDQQRVIITELGVDPQFDADYEIIRRVNFLADYLVKTGTRALVLGISGGVDSLVGGCLGQRAVEKVRAGGGDAVFVAMRLPYGKQHDEDDAQVALKIIQADKLVSVNIKPASDAMLDALVAGQVAFRDAAQQD